MGRCVRRCYAVGVLCHALFLLSSGIRSAAITALRLDQPASTITALLECVSMRHRWQGCAIDGRVIVGTVASASFDRPLQRLVATAAQVFGARFSCVAAAVMGHADFGAARDRRVALLPPPRNPLLPRQQWCGDSRYGWRRSHLFRARMWRLVLAARLDLLREAVRERKLVGQVEYTIYSL